MEKLYEALYGSGQYTKTFNDFQNQFSSQEGQEKLYGALKSSGDYTKSFNDFSGQFFGAPVKINDSASADPAVESNSDTGSKSESGSSESQNKTEGGFFSQFIGSLIDGAKEGFLRVDAIPDALKFFNKNEDLSNKEYYDFIETQEKAEPKPDENLIAFQKDFTETAEKYGYIYAAAKATATPEGVLSLAKVATSSFASQIKTIAPQFLGGADLPIEDDATLLAYGAGGATVGAGANMLGRALLKVPNPYAKVAGLGLTQLGKYSGGFAGLMGGASRTMEKAFTTMEMVNSSASEIYGDEFTNGTPEERVQIYRNIRNNPDVFNEIKSNAIARANTIGTIDAVTGLMTMGIGKSAFSAASISRLSPAASLIKLGAAGATESTGGFLSEYLGQKAGNQEFDPFEILLETIGDKVFTVTELRNMKNPSYKLNGEKLNGKKFFDALTIMDDDAYVNAKIQINNSPYADLVVNNRRSNIAFDQKVDSRINGVEDRANAIKLLQEKSKLDNNPSGNATRLFEIKTELSEIENKYKNSTIDVTIEQRKQAVADAVENRFEAEFNKNYRAGTQEATGIETKILEDDNSFFNEIANLYNVSLNEAANLAKDTNAAFVGKGKVLINKAAARREIDIATGNMGAVSVASHEVLHPIFNALIGNAETQANFVKDFRSRMTSKQKSYVDNQLKSRRYTKAQEATELMNIFSDGIIKGEITYDQTAFEKLKDAIISAFKDITTISFDSGSDVYNFLKEYNTSVKKGKISEKATEAIKTAERQKGVKVSEASVEGDIQFSKTDLNKVKQELSNIKAEEVESAVNRNKIAALLPNMISTQINNKFSNLDPSTREEFTFDVLEKMLRPNKQGINKDLQWDGRGDLYGFLNGRINLRIRDAVREDYNRPAAERLYVGRIDPKQIDDLVKEPSTEPTQESTPKPKQEGESVKRGQAVFKDLDVVDKDVTEQIENDIAKEIRVRTQKGTLSETFEVKKGRSVFLVSWIENYIDKAVFKILSKKLGAIGEKNGQTVIPPAYIDFLQSKETFDIITKALSIKSIKKSYGKLFNIEQIGREETAEGNPIFKIQKINKPAFFKYFVDGKKSTILERQKQLFREILTPSVKEAVAKYSTPENLVKLKEIQTLAPEQAVDIVENIVIEAQLQDLESKIDRYKGEDKSFDIIQFQKADIAAYDRKVVNSKSIKNALKLKEDSIEFLALPQSLKLATQFVNETLKLKGTNLGGVIYELLSLERISSFAGAKLKVKTLRGELGGFDSNRPDIQVSIKKEGKNVVVNIELKQSPFARFGQTTLGYDQNAEEKFNIRSKRKNSDGSLKQMTFDDVPTGKQLKSALDKSEKYLKAILKLINKEENKKFTGFPLGGSISTATVDKIYKSKAYKELKKISTEADGKTVSDHYNAKDTYVIQIGGRGVYIMGNDVFGLNSKIKDPASIVPSLDNIEFKGVMRLKFNYNRKKGTATVSLISEPQIKNKKKFEKSPINLDVKQGVTAFTNRLQPSKTLKGDTYGMADIVSRRLFNNDFFKLKPSQQDKVKEEMIKHKLIQFSQQSISNVNKAKAMANRPNAPVKGISVWDFDDTLARTKSNILYTLPDGKKGKLNATEFALRSGELEAQGAKFDFSEFEKVIKGRKGPMFEKALARNKKFGNANVFILTARPDAAKYAIHEFLKGIGLNIKVENIVGLADGDPQAKANWVISKVAEGYNDFYFADDAYKNVKAVQDVLTEADVKSKVHQAKVQFSRNLNKEFNDILEGATGIRADETISDAMARIKGAKKNAFKFFLPPSAEDFSGLLYSLLAKGKKGEQQQAWFKQALFTPFGKGIAEFETYKQNVTTIVNNLKKQLTDIPQGLKEENISGFTNEQSIRVYLWTKNGYSIEGISKKEQDLLTGIVENNFLFKSFADQLNSVLEGYPEPRGDWLAGTITTDAINMINTAKRSEFLQEWQQNVDVIFSKDNINKIRSEFGDDYVDALQDILYRMKTGRNRPAGRNKLTNQFMNWVNDSVGTIMFFNTRSALLQTLSIINFVNWGDNNPVLAAQAFDNQDQFWKDFSTIFNSDFLKQRRSGLKNDVNADDIASAAKTATNKTQAALSAILKIGFLPTQMADSFAIAMGGASFFRNRINTYLKQGLTQQEAESKAFLDFKEIAEETQQSSRPDRISQQQASPLGRLVLAFANTPMQYMRLTKKAYLDLVNGRGDAKTNITKILYYSTIQNIIFSSLQSAIFMMAFDDSDDELMDNKVQYAANNMLDTILRGSGIYGAIASTVKNILLEINKQSEKPRPDYTMAAIRAFSLSPPMDSKVRKLMSAGRAFSYKSVREKMTGYNLDNPAFYAIGQIVSATTNVPLDRLVRKSRHIQIAFTGDVAFWQRIALLLGYSEWDLGLIETSSSKKKKKKFGSSTKWKKRQ